MKIDMENGEGNLEGEFGRLGLGDPMVNANGNDGLFQVMKAVEAAEATIKQQVEENNRLRFELQKRNEELERYKSDNVGLESSESGHRWEDRVSDPRQSDLMAEGVNQMGGIRNSDNSYGRDMSNSIVLQRDTLRNYADGAQTQTDKFYDDRKLNQPLKVISSGLFSSENSGFSQFASPSITSFSPNRYALEDNISSQLNISRRSLTDMAEVNGPTSPKQDLVKVQEHDEEILQLRKHLAEYSMKEQQISNEKYALEKRISYMRMAFDQQQQDLVDAASKAITYRQEIMEENVRLTYALQAAQQERSTYVSSLMPLLAEYSLQPPVADAQSIVSNVKVLFRHLQEQLLLTESKLKESHYLLAPWRSDAQPSNSGQSPLHPVEIKNGLELVPQTTYLDGKIPSSDTQISGGGDLLGRPQSGMDDAVQNSEQDYSESNPPLASRTTPSWAESHSVRNTEETVSKKVTFGDLVRRSDVDEPDNMGQQSDRELSGNWTSKASAYPVYPEDPNSSYSPFLPPVLEEPSSSFSEAADDDPLPAIDGLQISGEAFPGRQLQACGYSIHGTTSCNFEWVRHLEDGSFNYIEGAKQPNYLVTADDVDTYLAIEVQPLDDRKRKGELVKVFANDHSKITCDPEMQSSIEKTLYSGHASYKLSLSSGFLDIWEPATLSIKRDGYSIKCSGPSGVVVTEKFSPSTIVSIPFGSLTDLCIIDSLGIERMLRVDDSTADMSGARDTIVLTLRLFIIKASEKRKGKKRGLFFK